MFATNSVELEKKLQAGKYTITSTSLRAIISLSPWCEIEMGLPLKLVENELDTSIFLSFHRNKSNRFINFGLGSESPKSEVTETTGNGEWISKRAMLRVCA